MDKWPYSHVAAHRGGGKLAPENTLAGVHTARLHTHNMVEFDVKLSADNQIFLLHDDHVDRTSNGHGLAVEMQYAQIAQLDAGSWFGPCFRNEAMPTLESAAQYCLTHQLAVNIEIKPSAAHEVEMGHMVALEAKRLWHSVMPAPLLSSFSYQSLQAAKSVVPGLPRGLLFGKVPANWYALCCSLECTSVHVNYRYLTPQLIAQVKKAGFYLFAYTINELETAQTLINLGIDCICTDHIDIITPNTLKR